MGKVDGGKDLTESCSKGKNNYTRVNGHPVHRKNSGIKVNATKVFQDTNSQNTRCVLEYSYYAETRVLQQGKVVLQRCNNCLIYC